MINTNPKILSLQDLAHHLDKMVGLPDCVPGCWLDVGGRILPGTYRSGEYFVRFDSRHETIGERSEMGKLLVSDI